MERSFTVPLQRWTSSVAFHPRGTLVAVAGKDSNLLRPGEVQVWDATANRKRWSARGHRMNMNLVRFSPDGTRLITAGMDGTVKLWNVADGKPLATFDASSALVWALALSPDGKHLATAGNNPIIRVWDVGSGKEVATLRGHSQQCTGLEFSPNGRRLASASATAACVSGTLPPAARLPLPSTTTAT